MRPKPRKPSKGSFRKGDKIVSRKGSMVSPEIRSAMHEAGHVVMCLHLGIRFDRIDIHHTKVIGGTTYAESGVADLDRLPPRQASDYFALALLAGSVAELGVYENDDRRREDLLLGFSLQAVLGKYNRMNRDQDKLRDLFQTLPADPNATFEDYYLKLLPRCVKIIYAKSNRRLVEAIAEALLKHKSLTRAQVLRIRRRINGASKHTTIARRKTRPTIRTR